MSRKDTLNRNEINQICQIDCKLGNFPDNILIINSCYEDDKTIMTRKCYTLFSDGVLP